MKYVKIVILGIVLGIMLSLSISTARAQATFPVVDLQPGDMKTLRTLGGYPWRQCGRYFASVTTEHGQITYYNYGIYRLKRDGKMKVLVDWKMIPTRTIRAAFDSHVSAPQVEWWSNRTEVRMNMRLWREALPCITEGVAS